MTPLRRALFLLALMAPTFAACDPCGDEPTLYDGCTAWVTYCACIKTSLVCLRCVGVGQLSQCHCGPSFAVPEEPIASNACGL